MLTLNYTYRLKPTLAQEEKLDSWLETCRVSFNYALRELKDWIGSRKCAIDRCSIQSEYIMPADYPFPSYHQQQNNLPSAKKKFPRLSEPPSQVMQTNIRRLHDAWDGFRKKGFGFPRYKKYGRMRSMLFPAIKPKHLTNWTLTLPKIGQVEIILHRPIPTGFVPKQVRVVKKAMGWFAIVSIQSNISIREPVPKGHFIGVDVGLLSYCATSDAFVEPGRKFFRTEHRKLKSLQRKLSKKQKRSKNYEKARKRVEKQHNHIAFKRKDYQFNLAHKLCDLADTIFLEDIDFRIMAKGFLGKHTLDAGFGQFRSILKYVGKRRDVYVDEVDHRGTSQTCPNCRIEVRKKLEDRIHSCPECFYEVDRDIASAQEICNRGIEKVAQGLCGKETAYQIVDLSGAMSLDKWLGVGMPSSDVRKPTLYSKS